MIRSFSLNLEILRVFYGRFFFAFQLEKKLKFLSCNKNFLMERYDRLFISTKLMVISFFLHLKVREVVKLALG